MWTSLKQGSTMPQNVSLKSNGYEFNIRCQTGKLW